MQTTNNLTTSGFQTTPVKRIVKPLVLPTVGGRQRFFTDCGQTGGTIVSTDSSL